jgi:hypothetical protein
MPNGVFPVPQFHPRKDAPELSLRLRTFWHRERLDAELARGTDPSASEELELRARQLLGRRGEIATALEGVDERAQRPYAFTVEVPVRRAAVRDCSADLQALARRLRDQPPVDPHGVALAWSLLTNGSSPLYLDSGVSLRHAIRSARLALDPIAAPVHELATAA